MEPPVPNCPITGEPALRRVQWLPTATLNWLWRVSFRTDTRRLLAGLSRFGLWESPAGLMFFDPPIPGDRQFYQDFYNGFRFHDRLSGAGVVRPDFVFAEARLKPGMVVLDVGCGEGGLARSLPGVDYWGLDMNFGGARPRILAETIEQHAARLPDHYDAVCAFQVAEHVADPLGFVGAMARALKPGGLLILGVPLWPAPVTAIPNFVMNAPPHHLSWWNERALRALCDRLGLGCREIWPVPVGRHSSVLYWMGRLSPHIGGGRYFMWKYRWHVALLWSYLAGALADKILSPPRDAAGSEIVLVAEKP
jgi:SAM-dependent methyltransferase